ncbi:peptidylprolyl isomerase [Streptomyces sp. MUM 178J]|uniref:peptidylprolyl isomerase n=1 Tax=Streptomyces sp. MUM 178J TaxID=2791991 RepID=UPI001F040994|nr:peptidylprolyl isomerase [Streptomyces sp. MUM 178J]WRQ78502.1 peptidylprolyl isomerase [Streptomyces sp. MUM 178J]
MASSDQRRRELARKKFERQQQRRAEARRKARRRNAVIATALGVVLIGGVVAAGAGWLSDDGGKDGETVADTPGSTPSAEPTPSESGSPEPEMAIDQKGKYTFAMETNEGPVSIAMDAAKTPHTVNSFKALADKGFFNGTKCHRLTTQGIYVLQCGDPQGDGTGGPGYTIPDENLDALGKAGEDGQVTYPAGTVAMANTGAPDSGGSQFFLVYKDSKLTPTYTPFGTMDKDGLKLVEDVAKAGVEGGASDGAPKKPVTIEKATVPKA